VGKLVAMRDQTADGQTNLVLYPKGAVPPELAFSVSQAFLRAGHVEKAGCWHILPAETVIDFSTSLQLFENFAWVANGTAPPDTLIKQQWDGSGEELSIFVDAGVAPDWPFDRYLWQQITVGSRRALALMGAGLAKEVMLP